MREQIDFSDCSPILGRAYNGANGKKIAIRYGNVQYMLKFPPSGAAKPTELSYTNSCISEYIGSNIYNFLGIKAQQTILGTFQVGAKKKIVCACRDFTADGKRFFDFCSMKNTILESDSGGSGTELEDILDTIEKQQYLPPEELTEHFWNMFVIDAFLGNFDRHNGNWGFLFDDITGKAAIAPVFDCGSCLLPQADERIMVDVLTNKKELHARVFQFPTSAIKLNGRKINYYDFLVTGVYKDCNASVGRIVPRIDMKQIAKFIEEVPYITERQKEFYRSYLQARFDLILKPAFDQIGFCAGGRL